MKLLDSIQKIPSIGPKYTETLNNLGIHTIQDILEHYPRDYFDSSAFSEISNLDRQEKRSFVAVVKNLHSIRTRKRNFTIQTAVLEDNSASIEAVWFNQPFLKNSLKAGESYIFSGKLNPKSYKPQVQSPQFEEIKETQTHLGIITPIYALTEGVSEKWIRTKIKWIVDKLDYIDDLGETLPATVIEKYGLMGRGEALRAIHFPKDDNSLKKARERLGFEELYEIQKAGLKKAKAMEKFKGPELSMPDKELEEFLGSLKFRLTSDQLNAIEEIREDLKGPRPMNRLLSGDVGSGKTIVAVAASLIAAKNGFQAAILTPTTILAEQHFKTINELIDNRRLNIQLVTSGKTIEGKAGTGKADIIIGTHAILHQKQKLFNKLGLIIVDEQHRFGVEQRENLKEIQKNTINDLVPHYLNMTATPIPRTLAMTLFNNINLSTIKTKPLGRKSTKTHLVPHSKREDGLSWLKNEAEKGTQIFWIAPLIEDSEVLETKSVETLYKKLRTALPELKIEKLHGRMKSEEKQSVLQNFRDFEKKKINILVSTSVIEVGIDIPNANIIVIEGAERFGLAQLHQLRGRVGRSDRQAYCFLFTSSEPTKEQKERLEYFVKTNDGFELAEYDLKIRGPGEVYGTIQSGIPNLKIANIFDLDLVKKARDAAELSLK